MRPIEIRFSHFLHLRLWTCRGLPRAVLIAVAAFCCGSATAPPKRLALIIGNESYLYGPTPLPNAINDASAVSRRLSAMGFTVVPHTNDLRRDALRNAVRDFGKLIKANGPNVVTFVYYSGHAAQDETGVNYLLPIDAHATTPEAVRDEGAALQPLLQDMDDSQNDVNFVVLDACRSWFTAGSAATYPAGLADMGREARVLIAYATRPGETADEGPNGNNSPYEKRLLENLVDTKTPIVVVFASVDSEVSNDTDSKQSPVYEDGLEKAGLWSLHSENLDQVGDTLHPTKTAAVPAFMNTLDYARLLSFFRDPKTRAEKKSFADAFMSRRDIMAAFHINTPRRLAFFLAAIAHETGGFQLQEEKFGYSAQHLFTVFRNRFQSLEIAQRYASLKNPIAVANRMYADKLGNGDEASGDGWRYRGRGLFFVTGRGNYASYGRVIGVDLVDQPDLANNLDTGFAIAAAIWDLRGANKAADENDLATAAKRYVGVADDIRDREKWLHAAYDAIGMH